MADMPKTMVDDAAAANRDLGSAAPAMPAIPEVDARVDVAAKQYRDGMIHSQNMAVVSVAKDLASLPEKDAKQLAERFETLTGFSRDAMMAEVAKAKAA